MEEKQMVIKKTWKEFQDAKLLWWINRILHTFGWAIVFVQEEDGSISDVYPARVRFRGFHEKSEEKGFIGLTEYLKNNIDELIEETKD
jgi:hypothetical protein